MTELGNLSLESCPRVFSLFVAQLYLAPFSHNLTRIASIVQMFCHYPKAVLSGVCRTPTRSPPSMEQAQLSWPGRKWCEFLKESPIESSSITTPLSSYPVCILNKSLQGIQQRSFLWDPTVMTRYIVIQTCQQTCVYTVSMFGWRALHSGVACACCRMHCAS